MSAGNLFADIYPSSFKISHDIIADNIEHLYDGEDAVHITTVQ